MTTIPEERADILDKLGFAHVATIGPDGAPQSNPVWFDWDGTYLRFSQTTRTQKYRNVRRDDRIAVSIHDPDDPYRYLELRGRVERIDDDADYAFINRMSKKYFGQDPYPGLQPGEDRVIVVLRPEHTTMQ